MFLHLKMAKLEGYQNVVITSEDTDVFILAMCITSASDITIYQKRGAAARSRFINVSAISMQLVQDSQSVCQDSMPTQVATPSVHLLERGS